MEIMMVVGIIAMLAAIALPAYQRNRKRAQATMVKQELRMIDNAITQYAFENNKSTGAIVAFPYLKPYLKDSSPLYATGADLFGNAYGPTFTVSTYPSVPSATYQALSDATDTVFWSPYLTP